MDIIWRPVPGFERTHEISSDGRVRSIQRRGVRSGMVLKPWTDPKGYVRVTILGKTKKMHRLVLEAFDRPPLPGEEASHLDGNPANNERANLAWKHPVANSADRVDHGTLAWGSRHGAAKLTDQDVTNIRRLRARGLMWKEIHNDYPQISRSTLIEAGTGVTFRHLDGYCPEPSSRAVRVRRDSGNPAALSP